MQFFVHLCKTSIHTPQTPSRLVLLLYQDMAHHLVFLSVSQSVQGMCGSSRTLKVSCQNHRSTLDQL